MRHQKPENQIPLPDIVDFNLRVPATLAFVPDPTRRVMTSHTNGSRLLPDSAFANCDSLWIRQAQTEPLSYFPPRVRQDEGNKEASGVFEAHQCCVADCIGDGATAECEHADIMIHKRTQIGSLRGLYLADFRQRN